MMITPFVSLRGIPAAIMKLKKTVRRMDNWREPFQEITQDYFQVQRSWLNSEGRSSYESLRYLYKKWKDKRAPGKPILQLTGAMYNDLTGVTTRVEFKRDGVVLRTGKSGNRWKHHQDGTSTGNRSGFRRPKRNPISPALRIRQAKWNSILRRWASGA